MKIVKPTKTGISQAIKILKNQGVIVYPTDTAYALGGVFNKPKVNRRILQVKERLDPKFTLIAADLAQVKKYFKFNANQEKLAKAFWPGPLSIVVSKKFAVRVPKNKIARLLAAKIGKPLIATSANISGQKTLYSSQTVINQFKNKKNQPDLILAAGRLKVIKTSTLVLTNKDGIQILRSGAVRIPKNFSLK